MNEYAAKQAQQAAYDAQIRASQCLGTLHQDGTFEAMQMSANRQSMPRGEIGTQAAAVTLTGQIVTAHALVDHLGEIVAGLEKRLSPILSSNYPESQKDGSAISCDPPVIEEMDRLLNRLRSVCAYLDSIERRTRI